MNDKTKFIITTGVVLTLLPVFRSGSRTGLNLWEFILNHTIFGPPVEYVPSEDYMAALDRGR